MTEAPLYNLMLSIASNLVLSSIKSTTVAAVSKVESSTNPKLQLLMSTAISQDSEGVGSAQNQDNEEWTPIEKAIEDVLQVSANNGLWIFQFEIILASKL